VLDRVVALLYVRDLAAVVLVGLTDRVGVKVVARFLAQKEDRAVRLGGSVGDRLGHGIDLVPNDLAAQIPAVRAEREREHPRLA
jgi:hypothetical protein